MKKRILLIILYLTANISLGQEVLTSIDSIAGKEINTSVRLNYVPVSMPFDNFPRSIDKTMHMIGLHYQIPFGKRFYGGVGMYGAILGDQSGFFTLGATLGYSQPITSSLFLDANLHLGGGGSTSELVNGGLLVNPNIGLQYKLRNYSFGLQYSIVDFPTGIIRSDSWSVFLEIPSLLRVADYKDAHKEFVISNINKDSFWNKPVVKSAQQIRFDFLFPIGKSRTDDLQELNTTLYMLGFEYQKYLSEKAFVYVHTDAIYRGLTAGYMDLFFGYGYNWVDTKHLNLYTKIGIGAAGGRIAQEGGLTAYPSAGFDLKLSNKLAFTGHAGYFRFLDGTFEAYTTGFGLKYFNFSGGTKNTNGDYFKKGSTKGIQLAIENQWYWNMRRRGRNATDIEQLAVRIMVDLSHSFYFLGEASFAYGGEAGGYAHGIVGAGYYIKALQNSKFSPFIECSAGVAGGGKIDTQGGLVLRPALGINYSISNQLNIRTSYAQLYSPSGVNAPNLNIGVAYKFSFLHAAK